MERADRGRESRRWWNERKRSQASSESGGACVLLLPFSNQAGIGCLILASGRSPEALNLD